MVSAAELRHQRYASIAGDHVAGDREFTDVHDQFLRGVSELLRVNAVPLLIADCPQLVASDFVHSEMAAPERIAAWNAQVRRWVDSAPNIGLFPYAAAINERQQSHPDEHVLVDGIHADVDILIELIRSRLLDVIEAAAAG